MTPASGISASDNGAEVAGGGGRAAADDMDDTHSHGNDNEAVSGGECEDIAIHAEDTCTGNGLDAGSGGEEKNQEETDGDDNDNDDAANSDETCDDNDKYMHDGVVYDGIGIGIQHAFDNEDVPFLFLSLAVVVATIFAQRQGITRATSSNMPQIHLFGEGLTFMLQDVVAYGGNYDEILSEELASSDSTTAVGWNCVL